MHIDGVRVTALSRIPDDRGAIMHMMRADREPFQRFGEIYFSLIYPGIVKGWHRHHRMTLNYAAPVGMAKIVCYDARPESSTLGGIWEICIGDMNYALVTIPPMVWNGFVAVGPRPALLANCSDEPHDPAEIERADPFGDLVQYTWGAVSR